MSRPDLKVQARLLTGLTRPISLDEDESALVSLMLVAAAEQRNDVAVSDTADGDVVPTMFNWPVDRLVVLETPILGKPDPHTIFIAVDRDDCAITAQEGGRPEVAEMNAWSIFYSIRENNLTSRSGLPMKGAFCPACGFVMTFIRTGDRVGYAMCAKCTWSECGEQFRHTQHLVTKPWPPRAVLSLSPEGGGSHVEVLFGPTKRIHGRGATPAEAEEDAHDQYLHLIGQ